MDLSIIEKATNIFTMVEFNLLNYCNRNCSFCPVIIPAKKKELPLDYFRIVMDQLKVVNYAGLISFSGFSEPLLHTELYKLVDMKNKYIPNSYLTVNTNGDKLTQHMAQTLFNKGVSLIQVSQYEENLDNKRIKWYSKSKNILKRDRYSNEDFINNRAGAIKTENSIPDNICFYPFYSLYIDYNGDTLFCPHNYNKQNVLGNITKKSLLDMWTGEEINKIRGNRNYPPCSKCDVRGDKVGRINYEEHRKR